MRARDADDFVGAFERGELDGEGADGACGSGDDDCVAWFELSNFGDALEGGGDERFCEMKGLVGRTYEVRSQPYIVLCVQAESQRENDCNSSPTPPRMPR